MALTYLLATIFATGLWQLLEANQQPPIYVIDHKLSPQWNNQRLIVRPEPVEQPALSASSRRGKQMFYTDQVPNEQGDSYKWLLGDQNPTLEHHFDRQLLLQPRKSSKPATASSKSSSTKGGARGKSAVGSPRQHFPGLSRSAGNSTTTSVAANNHHNRASTKTNNNLVCYYGTWAVYRPENGKYPVENIDPFLCTHIIYGFTGLSFDNLIKPLDPWNDLEDNYGKGAMKRFTNLKRINPDLKTLVAIGGWNEGSIKYSKMASEPESRAKFVQSVVDFLQKYNFDGLDLDWEYPGSRGGFSYDKQNFVKLLRELKQAFEPHNYLLTAAVSAGKWFMDPGYDIPQVSRYLDLINLMAYDYHGGWETKTGMNAPLFGSSKHDLSREDSYLNVNWSVNYWLQQGAPREKLMLGVGSYGRSFTLDRPTETGINAPASQKGQAGPYTREPGSLGYNEICESFKRQPQAWTIVRDPDYLAPYAYNGRQWVGYDDMQSLQLKAQYAKSMGLGGVMMWSIETDDFQGFCHDEKYPLLNTIKRVLAGKPTGVSPSGSSTARPARPAQTTLRPAVTPTTPGKGEVEDDLPSSSTRRPNRPTTSTTSSTTSSTTRRPRPSSSSTTGLPTWTTSTTTTTTTTSTTTSIKPNEADEFVCRADGMFADPQNCRKFIRCVSSGGPNYTMYKFDCGPGTAFNEPQQYCDHIYNVPNCPANKQQPMRVNSSPMSSLRASNKLAPFNRRYQLHLYGQHPAILHTSHQYTFVGHN